MRLLLLHLQNKYSRCDMMRLQGKHKHHVVLLLLIKLLQLQNKYLKKAPRPELLDGQI